MRFLVFQHVAIEHPGAFRRLMELAGVAWDTVELDAGEPIPDLDCYDALLVFGGPMDVWDEAEHPWLIPEKAAVRTFVEGLGRPFLGVCLGHQLLADALGGRVGRMSGPEVGVRTVHLAASARTDPVFAGLPAALECVQWHGAEVQELPPRSTVLASSRQCAVQALRVGRHAYGVQFHVEVEDGTLAEWSRIPAYRLSLQEALGPDGARAFGADAAARMDDFTRMAEVLFSGFQDVVRAARA